MIRTRFAPSPTGNLHIGGVRTALFSYLYARNSQGKFLLRIEDTDRERSRPEFERDILNSLEWLGLSWDEPVVYQSRRLERYRELAGVLIARDLAYEETVEGRLAVKFKMPARQFKFQDAVRGEVAFDSSLFGDLVILKSDGYPTYHFACVVDDHDMEISHVIRGEDHLSNTPRQVLIFEALGWRPPKYAHLPLILGPDGVPLSKRHGITSLSAYRQEGFLPEAVLNYLALLGWGSDSNQEFFSIENLIKKFSLKRITKSGARFNREKMEWVNAQHLKNLGEAEFLKQLSAYYPKDAARFPDAVWKRFALLYKTRLKTFRDLKEQADYFFAEELGYDENAFKPFFANDQLKGYLEAWIQKAKQLADFSDAAQIEQMTRATAEGCGVQAKDLIHPLRFSVTAKTVSPGLFEVMQVLGKDVCLKRVQAFAAGGPRHV